MERKFISFDQAELHEKRRKEDRRERIVNTLWGLALATLLGLAIYFNLTIGGGL